MSILKPIDGHGPYIPFNSPAPCPPNDILSTPQVSISFNETWIPAVFTALKALTRPESWVGTLADINRCTQDAHNLFDTGSGTMQIGTVLATLLAALPSNWLACDGSSYLRVDYPVLYAAIDAAYIIDADHFKVPDLRGRTPIGSGTGTGLTPRTVNAQGGAETHLLTVPEIPAHNHTIITSQTFVSGQPQRVKREDSNNTSSVTTQNAGGGGVHNNMQPFTAVKWAVVAK